MTIDINGLLSKAAVTIFAAVALSGGTAIIKNANAISVLQSQHEGDSQRLERIESKLDRVLERVYEPR